MGPSLYDLLSGQLLPQLPLNQVDDERQQRILSVQANIQRILNSRAGAIAHLPDYGLADLTNVMPGLSASAHNLIEQIKARLMKYEPRLQEIEVTLMPTADLIHLHYQLSANIKGIGRIDFHYHYHADGSMTLQSPTKENEDEKS